MIYFVECADFIKIGYTSNVERRVKSFKSANPYPVTLLFAARGGFAAEQRLHKRFQQYHHQGEWFRKCPELLAGIEAARKELNAAPPVRNEISHQEFVNQLICDFKLTPKEIELMNSLQTINQATRHG